MAIQPETLTRGLVDDVQVRAVDDASRTATFVAATENGVETIFGREYLRMSGADLTRYRRNPVVLDTHNRFEAGGVIGKAVVSLNGSLMADVTFAETARAEEVWQLVRTGFLSALSIGFRPLDVQVVPDGESVVFGSRSIEGPARIIKEWELFEISVLPVPADAEALKRSFLHGESVELVPHVRSLVEAESLPGEIHRREVMAICPRGLEDMAERCILEGMSLDDTRERILEVHNERRVPGGRGGALKVADVSDEALLRSLCGP